MLDVTEQLRRYGEAVFDTVAPVPLEGIGAPRDAAPRTRRMSRRGSLLVAASACVVVLVGGALIWTAASPDRAARRGASSAGAGSAVAVLAPWPLAPRSDVAMAWTGHEVVVWGGDVEAFNEGVPGPDRQFADGAAFDPATGRWRRMSLGPLAATADVPRAAVVDGVVVIARGLQAAAWDPGTDTWRSLDDVRDPYSQLVVAGDRIVSIARDANGNLAGADELDLQRGTWRRLPDPPLALDRPTAAWDGAEIVVVGQRTFYESAALAYDPPAAAWRELEPPTMLNPAALSAAREGDRVVYVDHEMGAAAHRRGTDGWEALPPVPARFYENIPVIEAAGPVLVARTGAAFVVRTGDGPWVPLSIDTFDLWSWASVVAPADAANDRAHLFVFGRAPGGATRFLGVDPARLAAEARVLQVGVAQVRLPDGVELTDSSYDPTRSRETVRIDLGTPRGPCTMTSAYRPGAGVTPWAAADAAGTTWTAGATDSDRVEVTCTDAEMARLLTMATPLPPPPPHP